MSCQRSIRFIHMPLQQGKKLILLYSFLVNFQALVTSDWFKTGGGGNFIIRGGKSNQSGFYESSTEPELPNKDI